MRLEPSRRFRRAFARLGGGDRKRVETALQRFLANPSHPGLKFEPVTASLDIWTIRASRGLRIFLRREAADRYTIVTVGPHDLYDRL